MLFELKSCADEFVSILPDHLCDDGTVGGVFGDGAKDVGLDAGVDVDAKVFGDIDIRSSKGGHRSKEGEVGDVLHGSQKKSRTV